MLNIFSTNAAGLVNKTNCLKNHIKNLDVAIFMIQETHFTRKGKFKLDDYETFESIRSKKHGGSLIGVHKALEPVLIEEYNDDFELLVVEIQIANKEIRLITGYGPQENLCEMERMSFFLALEQEIIRAEMAGKSVIIAMDANSKLGPELIPNDPNERTPNGQILADIMLRHGLAVVNGMQNKCEGTVTRKRVTIEGVEESAIDFVIVSDDLESAVESLLIDEKRDYVLTKIVKTKRGVSKQESDHNVLVSKLKLSWNSKKTVKRI